jgi:TPR repeat protein
VKPRITTFVASGVLALALFGEAMADLGEMYRDGQGAPQDFVRAYMWFNLVVSGASGASIRDQAVRDRNELAAKMTPAQIAEAQRLASGWAPKK